MNGVPITGELLGQLHAAIVDDGRIDEDLPARLWGSFPGLRITHCSEDDVSPRAKPWSEEAGWKLFLVGGDHCLGLVGAPEMACGVLIAEVVEDDED